MFRAISAAALPLRVAHAPNHASAVEITLSSPGAVGSSLRELVPGPLPAEIQLYTDYAAGVMAVSQHQDAGKALIAFLATPAASAVMKSKGFTQF